MGNCCKRRNVKKKIVLLLVGLDNAGKTKAANGLAGDICSSPVPTVGFSVVHLKYLNYDVNIFDLGGGPNIRGIWHRYFVNAHGLIFVVDSSDFSRFDEVKSVLEEIVSNSKIAGKPILILANKQDNENALDEIDVIEYLNIEQLVNRHKCPTLVQSCSATEMNSKLDPGIKSGYEWLLSNVVRNYQILNQRVEVESREQEIKEREEMAEKIRRIRELQDIERNQTNHDVIETYSNYIQKISSLENTQKDEQILEVADFQNVEISSSYSNSSSISFPPIYVPSNCGLTERPKSAVQIIKHQLELSKPTRKQSLPMKTNKTIPFSLYGDRPSHSAQERRGNFSLTHRHLKSADDTILMKNFTSNGLSHMGPSGDYHVPPPKELFQSNRSSRFPPLKCKNKIVPWNQQQNGDAISVIKIE